MVRIDIENFFPSVTVGTLLRERLFHRVAHTLKMSFDKAEAFLFVPEGMTSRLPQGAPTSPLIADLALTTFDFRTVRNLLLLLSEKGFDVTTLAYTRYVDDLVISTTEPLADRLAIFRDAVTAVVQKNLSTISLNTAPNKTRLSVVVAGLPAFCVGFSLAGGRLQTSRTIRERARSVCWKIVHGNRITQRDRGILAYALQGRFRVPAKLLTALTRGQVEPKLARWLQRQLAESDNLAAERAGERGAIQLLCSSVIHRFREARGIRALLFYDLALLHHLGTAMTISPNSIRVVTNGVESFFSLSNDEVGLFTAGVRSVAHDVEVLLTLKVNKVL